MELTFPVAPETLKGQGDTGEGAFPRPQSPHTAAQQGRPEV